MADHSAYAILGLQKGASEQEIKHSFVNLVKKYDPEIHTDRFMVIQDAYNRLKDPKKRAKEDILTFNMIKGEFLFNNEETPEDANSPDESGIEQARDRYRQMAGDPAAKEAYLRLLMQRSYNLARRKLWMEAIHLWEEVSTVDPSHVRSRNNLMYGSIMLGTSYALHELYEDAVELWERALELNPDNVDLVHNLALGCEKAKLPEKAARYWAEVINRWKGKLKANNDDEYTRECIVEAHRHHGETMHPEAGETRDTRVVRRERYREVLEIKPDDFEAKFQLAQSLVEDRKYEEAVSELEDLQRKHPKNIEVLNVLAWAYLHRGNVDEAFQTWQKSMMIDSKNPVTRENVVRAHLTLGKQYRQKGMFTPALVHLKKLLKYMPRSAEVYMEIGATYDMKGDVRSAMQAYQQVITLDPKNKLARKAINDLRMKR
ncbi:MAG: hypothetical protein PWP23_2214 [Candidatus Sumerlaeota bacterium]|nr:hypothetical protein [Candidatus Sumerlaeota bacterium]